MAKEDLDLVVHLGDYLDEGKHSSYGSINGCDMLQKFIRLTIIATVMTDKN